MKNKINLAMRCNQEQWELLKPKLENAGYNDFEIDGFEEYKYLTNFLHAQEGRIGNIFDVSAGDYNREVHEEFNEKIFLEACGVFVIPTLEEVREYFKDAESVECLTSLVGENISKLHKKGIHYDIDSYWAEAVDIVAIYAEIWNPKQGYAKILTYKKEKFEITKETVIKYQMKDEFPEIFRTELVVGKWYKAYFKDIDEQWGFINITELKHLRIYFYGISFDSWRIKDWCHDENVFVEAATKEVTEALKNEALRRYKVGQVISSFISGFQEISCLEDFKLEDGIFEVNGVWLMKDGVWATIERDVITIQEAEELLNCKIV